MIQKTINIVWFKRDLRVHDHQPLVEAMKQAKPILLLVLDEPGYWQQPDISSLHYACWRSAVNSLQHQLKKRKLNLNFIRGDAVDIFSKLISQYEIDTVYAHQETGNNWTYQRDKCIAEILKKAAIPFKEYNQFAVIRRLQSRDDWQQHWQKIMKSPTLPAMTFPSEKSIVINIEVEEARIYNNGYHQISPLIWRTYAIMRLKQFLYHDAWQYQISISSPVTAELFCSRLSMYLSYGVISLREVFQATWRRRQNIYADNSPLSPEEKKLWYRNIKAFESRLYWHCHFIQRLEDQPSMEFKALLPQADALRPLPINPIYFDAFCQGRTGFPFVDACIRYLRKYGWINFRMRAMLTSFATCILWLDFRPVGLFLARCFADYEPGIHYSQIQMQSGVTGINAIRIYNPIKQGKEHDRTGDFIRTFVPELAAISDSEIHEPWLFQETIASKYNIHIDEDYPSPVIDYEEAYKFAKNVLFSFKKDRKTKQASQQVYIKHGSRMKRGKVRSKNEV